jgi:hypothetical protein
MAQVRVGLVVPGLKAHPGAEPEGAAVPEGDVELALQNKENMSFRAPVVGAISRRIFNDSGPDVPGLKNAPMRCSPFTRVFDGFDRTPIRDRKRDIENFHAILLFSPRPVDRSISNPVIYGEGWHGGGGRSRDRTPPLLEARIIHMEMLT